MLEHDAVRGESGEAFSFDQRGSEPQFELRPKLRDAEDRADAPPGACIAAGYRRCLAFDADDLPGQDFCAFQFDDHHAVGVVADGVSQSFFEDLAARIVGRALVEYLWERRARPPTEHEVHRRLDDEGAALARAVREQQIPAAPGTILRCALEQARAEGSQTVFGGVVLDRRNKFASVYLLGDITAIVRDPSPAPQHFSADKRGRWSSAGGLRGEIWHRTLSGVESVLLKSDGAADGWGEALDEVVREDVFRVRVHDWADKDDVSFVWVSAGAVVPPEPRPPPSAPTPPPQLGTPALPPVIERAYGRRALPKLALIAAVLLLVLGRQTDLPDLPDWLDADAGTGSGDRPGAPSADAAGAAGVRSEPTALTGGTTPSPPEQAARSALASSLLDLLSEISPKDSSASALFLIAAANGRDSQEISIDCRSDNSLNKADDGNYRDTIVVTNGIGLVRRVFRTGEHRCLLQLAGAGDRPEEPRASTSCSWSTAPRAAAGVKAHKGGKQPDPPKTGKKSAPTRSGDQADLMKTGKIRCYVLAEVHE